MTGWLLPGACAGATVGCDGTPKPGEELCPVLLLQVLCAPPTEGLPDTVLHAVCQAPY